MIKDPLQRLLERWEGVIRIEVESSIGSVVVKHLWLYLGGKLKWINSWRSNYQYPYQVPLYGLEELEGWREQERQLGD